MLADGSKPYFFMSHAQASGGAQTRLLTRLLENACPAVLLDKIWLDVDKDPTPEEMCKGIEDADYVIIFLTKGSLRRWFCQLEVRHALKVKSADRIILVNDEPSNDPNFGGYCE